MISGGTVKPDQAPILIATVVGILATMLQIGLYQAARPQGRRHAVGGVHW
jgi:intracellular septation protein